MENLDENNILKTYLIEIKGLVQGVGFRPFIYRLAKQYNYNGWVENRNDGVFVKINCTTNQLNDFVISLKLLAPIASNIESVKFFELDLEYFSEF